METPQLILGPDGTSPVAQLPHAVPGRISGLHYGTYDYSASLQISAEYQSMEHPVADFAKEVMQLAVAGTGIRLSDGSTNIIPVGGNVEKRLAAARPAGPPLAGTRLLPGLGPPPGPAAQPVRRHLRLLPARASPPPRPGCATTWSRPTAAFMDEPATARALAAFVLRGVQCGAVGAEEVLALAGVGLPQLTALAHPRLAATSNSSQ